MNISADTSRRRRTIELCSLPAPLLMPVLSCTLAACLSATTSLPAQAAPQAPPKTQQTEREAEVTRLPGLSIGRAQTVMLPPQASFRFQSGRELVSAAMQNDTLSLTGLKAGDVVIAVDAPNRATQLYKLRVRAAITSTVQADAQVQTRPEGVATAPQINDMGATGAPTGSTSTQAPGAPTSAAGAPTGIDGTNGNGAALSPLPPISPAPQRPLPSSLSGTRFPDTDSIPNIGPSVSTSRLPNNSGAFPLRGSLPSNVQQVARAGSSGRPAINVTQGLARILAFPSNILAVFFSDTNVMDARAINARSVAVTGLGAGQSTLAVFTARYAGDAVGRANIYRISVGQGGNLSFPSGTTPTTLENAINAAIGDPRVRVAVGRSPRGNAYVTLSGTVRDATEAQAAATIAGIYVPPQQVISRIVTAPTALSLQETLNDPNVATLSSEQILQGRLRQLTGNESIVLIPLPTGLGLKATVDSPQDAEAILNLVPVTVERPILPFIVVRGASGTLTDPSYYQRTVLTSEDQQSTRVLQSVTGVRTVYVVRTAQNGLAVYGTVRNRIEYDTVRRYARILPQVPGGTGTTGNTERANFPAGVNSFPIGVQLFVRILDPADQVVRRVNVETSIVEISRTAARNLGVELGSATVLSESFSPGNAGTLTVDPNGTQTATGGTPSVTTRTIDPTFNSGSFTLGNGFAGLSGGLGNLNPFRARINALYSNGAARVLSRPNLTAVEGAEAQITIGGSRPVPSTAISGSGGAVGQSVEFRRFGIILTMRPTVTDDDTIILQIRVDVSNLDPTSGINLNGAFVPGESVRSVDTTLTLREGDTIVMGGLITNDRRRATSRIPVLSQIPILGALFKSKQFQDNQTELAIFMSPQILRQQASPGTLVDVARVPALPALAGNQQRNEIFSFGGAGGGQ